MKRLALITLTAFFIVRSAAAEPLNEGFSYLHPQKAVYNNFSYLSPEAVTDSRQSALYALSGVPDLNKYETIISDGTGLQTLLYIAEEISPAVERYAFDDNATQSQLYMGLSSALLSYAVRKATGNQFNLRLHEEIKSDNKSDYSVELGFRPISAVELSFLVPTGEFMFGLSFYPTDDTIFSFTINDNETATITGVNINAVF
jgi:hypothetical protein